MQCYRAGVWDHPASTWWILWLHQKQWHCWPNKLCWQLKAAMQQLQAVPVHNQPQRKVHASDDLSICTHLCATWRSSQAIATTIWWSLVQTRLDPRSCMSFQSSDSNWHPWSVVAVDGTPGWHETQPTLRCTDTVESPEHCISCALAQPNATP